MLLFRPKDDFIQREEFTPSLFSSATAMTNRQHWFRDIFRALLSLESEDALAPHLADEDKRTEALLTAGPLDAGLVHHLYVQQDALGLVLRGRLHLEELLEAIIAKKFKYPDVLLHGRLSFSAKMDILRAANALDDRTYRDLIHISRLRNSFAHHLSSDLAAYDLSAFTDCKGLKAAAQKFPVPEARAILSTFFFRQILLQLILRLVVRHKLAASAPAATGEHEDDC